MYNIVFSQEFADKVIQNYPNYKRLNRFIAGQIKTLYSSTNGLKDSHHYLDEENNDQRLKNVRFGLKNYKGLSHPDSILETITAEYMLLSNQIFEKESNLFLYFKNDPKQGYQFEKLKAKITPIQLDMVRDFILERPKTIMLQTILDFAKQDINYNKALDPNSKIEESEELLLLTDEEILGFAERVIENSNELLKEIYSTKKSNQSNDEEKTREYNSNGMIIYDSSGEVVSINGIPCKINENQKDKKRNYYPAHEVIKDITPQN
ncbi:hypothetical protein HOK68_02255 [Candidatus Woesearchaeota archaeon]|jgi:hypothetical protein|nr:hypothetical protein [Candidatus Woesearchaeota archaeon]MBT4388023.1 hypothetical protein [Candidatus Woesearchaeota archaeon]MBT4596288.1 hypothetical protein [Candidatus Woesearchaeota archaeon]MBT5740790.1 hypothetical protein [Candidatus Woesearchaeota archaeon]MBT6505576.1 hypothetical protein [Candidatus Woesearchaeota archaeon]